MGHCPKGLTFDRPKGLRGVWLFAAGRRHIYSSPHRVIPQPSALRAVKPKNPPDDRPVKPKNLPVQPFYAACLRQQATTLGAKGPVNLPWNVKDPHRVASRWGPLYFGVWEWCNHRYMANASMKRYPGKTLQKKERRKTSRFLRLRYHQPGTGERTRPLLNMSPLQKH